MPSTPPHRRLGVQIVNPPHGLLFLFFQDVRQGIAGPLEQLFDHGRITRVLEVWIDCFPDEVEKGFQAGIAGSLGGLLLMLGEFV